jgi:hypothetical protein
MAKSGLQSNEEISQVFEQFYPIVKPSERGGCIDSLAKMNKVMKQTNNQAKQVSRLPTEDLGHPIHGTSTKVNK